MERTFNQTPSFHAPAVLLWDARNRETFGKPQINPLILDLPISFTYVPPLSPKSEPVVKLYSPLVPPSLNVRSEIFDVDENNPDSLRDKLYGTASTITVSRVFFDSITSLFL